MTAATTLHDGRHPATLLCHPLVFAAIAVCAVNDHVFKGSGLLPGAVTGKLSDVVGLFFFPILLAVLFYFALRAVTRLLPVVDRWLPGDNPRLYLDPAAILTIAVFTALNVSHTANALAEPYWGVVTMDATDLFCLPMVVVGHQFALKRWGPTDRAPAPTVSEQPERLKLSWHHWAAVAFAVVVSGATSPAPGQITVPGFPHWEVMTPVAYCHQDTEIRGWFAKSGKDGAGFVIRVDTAGNRTVTVDIDDVDFLVWGGEHRAHSPALEVEGEVDETTRAVHGGESIYVPFFFDNENAWESDLNNGRVEITLRIDDESADFRFDADHRTTSLTESYSYYAPAPYPGRPWGPHPDDPDLYVSGAHPQRADEYLLRYPDRPREFWVRAHPDWRGGCPERDDDSPDDARDHWVHSQTDWCGGCLEDDDE